MSQRRLTLLLLGLTALALLLALPGALREALARGELYLFTSELFRDIPLRLAGPGRLRFLFQPAIAALLGARDGAADGRAGRAPFLLGVLTGGASKRALLASSLRATANLVLMAILLDLVSQWLILGVAYPGAAFLVGPVLISTPYALARALANRFARSRRAPQPARGGSR